MVFKIIIAASSKTKLAVVDKHKSIFNLSLGTVNCIEIESNNSHASIFIEQRDIVLLHFLRVCFRQIVPVKLTCHRHLNFLNFQRVAVLTGVKL